MDYYKAKDYILKEIEKTGFKQQNFIIKAEDTRDFSHERNRLFIF